MDAEQRALVFDNGSFMIKVGFAGSNEPLLVPPVVCLPYFSQTAGEEAVRITPYYLKYTIEDDGDIKDGEDVKKVWDHIFKKMDIPSEESPVLLTENLFNSLGNREKTTEIMFENFSTPSLFMANEAVLSLHAAGQTTGVVLSCGDSLSHIVAIQEGKPLPHASLRLGYAGWQLTKFLMSMLNRSGHKFSVAQRKDVREIKEKLCYVALDFQQAAASESNQGKSYELPDGSLITINDEQFRCPEALFQPHLMGSDYSDIAGVHQEIYNSVMKCDEELRKDLFAHTVLSGGSTMFRGIAERLQNEISALAPDGTKVKVVAPRERQHSAWIGGSVLASLSTYRQHWISKQEYDESGSSIIHRKCPKI